MGLIVESEVPPPSGEKLVREGREIGEVTSSCVAPTLGKTIAMAYLRCEVSEPGTKLGFPSGTIAEVAALPFYQRNPTPSAT
jgi:glycine cleavage system aminomethyltransferase T